MLRSRRACGYVFPEPSYRDLWKGQWRGRHERTKRVMKTRTRAARCSAYPFGRQSGSKAETRTKKPGKGYLWWAAEA